MLKTYCVNYVSKHLCAIYALYVEYYYIYLFLHAIELQNFLESIKVSWVLSPVANFLIHFVFVF